MLSTEGLFRCITTLNCGETRRTLEARVETFYTLPDTRVLNSFEELTLCERQPKIPSPECSTPMGERMYCHPQTDCFIVSQLFYVDRQLGRLYIYICIYIYCHPQTDCFVLSELFSVARHVGRLKSGSKPIQLYVRLSLRPLGQQAYHVG